MDLRGTGRMGTNAGGRGAGHAGVVYWDDEGEGDDKEAKTIKIVSAKIKLDFTTVSR